MYSGGAAVGPVVTAAVYGQGGWDGATGTLTLLSALLLLTTICATLATRTAASPAADHATNAERPPVEGEGQRRGFSYDRFL